MADKPAPPDPDRLKSLDERLTRLKGSQASPPKTEEHYSQAQVAWRMVTELVAGLGIGFGIGYGLDALFGLVRDALPDSLFETAYALACDVVAADGSAQGPELRILDFAGQHLNMGALFLGGAGMDGVSPWVSLAVVLALIAAGLGVLRARVKPVEVVS